MASRLENIIQEKKLEVAALYQLIENQPSHALALLLQQKTRRQSSKDFKKALRASDLAVIAEIKRQSPSKGKLAEIIDPVDLAKTYVKGGANAISILTDQKFFSGNLNDLTQVAKALSDQPIPILRKDFIIDPIQIAEAVLAGADAVLLIVAVLGKETKKLLDFARALNIAALVEVHNEQELDIAIACGADIIGINNRDLTTFEIDPQQALRLLPTLPKNIIKIAESGITDPLFAQTYHRAGFDAVLIGEALVKSAHPDTFIKACQDEYRVN